jgi:hypothetical protein
MVSFSDSLYIQPLTLNIPPTPASKRGHFTTLKTVMLLYRLLFFLPLKIEKFRDYTKALDASASAAHRSPSNRYGCRSWPPERARAGRWEPSGSVASVCAVWQGKSGPGRAQCQRDAAPATGHSNEAIGVSILFPTLCNRSTPTAEVMNDVGVIEMINRGGWDRMWQCFNVCVENCYKYVMRSRIRRDSNFRSENCINYTVLPLEMCISLSGTSSVIIAALCVTLGQGINVKGDWINDFELIHIHMIILT